MGFLLVPNSVTLNDLERRNRPYFAFFSPSSIALEANYVTVVEDGPQCMRRKCSANNLVFICPIAY